MASNFGFLKDITEYRLFASACIEAENVLSTSPSMSGAGSRKAFELCVKWVYSVDSTMSMPYKDNLQALVYENSFRYSAEPSILGKLH